MKHSTTIPPSSAPALNQCAHYKSSNTYNESAKLGNAIHEACALIFQGIDPENTTLNTIQLEACYDSVDKAKRLIEYDYGKILSYKIEERVDIYDNNGELFTFGTQDLHLNCEKGVVGLDWKSGLDYDIEKVDYKSQMCFYASGRMQKYRINEIEWFEWYVIPNQYKRYTLNYDECKVQMLHAYERQCNKDSYEKNINYFCRYCDDFTDCSEINKGLVKFDYKNLPENIDKPDQSWSAQEFGCALSFRKNVISPMQTKLKEVSDNLKKEAFLKMEKQVIPGFEKGVRKHKQLSNPMKAFDVLQQQNIVNDEEFMSAAEFSINSLIDIFYRREKAKNPKFTQKLAKAEVLNALHKLLDYKESYFIRESK